MVQDVGTLVGGTGVSVAVLAGTLVGVLLGTGVAVEPPGVCVGKVVDVLVGMLVAVLAGMVVDVLVRVAVAPTGVPVAQAGKEKVSIWPAVIPLVSHEYWVNREPVSFCAPMVAPDPPCVRVP